MDSQLALTAAYQRLLSELSRRLGAEHAELLLHDGSAKSARTIAHAGAARAGEAARWLEIPIGFGSTLFSRSVLY